MLRLKPSILAWTLALWAQGALALAPTPTFPQSLFGNPLSGAGLVPLPAVLDLPAETSDDGDGSLRATLLSVAEDYGKATYVPYVWGGGAIGSPATCAACRECIKAKRRLPVERRRNVCRPCQDCGVDCSHFVNRIYKDAGMPFPYVTTRALKRLPPAKIRRDFSLVEIGKDLRQARPGDLLLKPKHIVLLLRMTGDRRGDIVHVSRSVSRQGIIGGIEIRRDVDVAKFAGRLVKIFRHEAIVAEEQEKALPKMRQPEPDRAGPLLVRSTPAAPTLDPARRL